MSDAQEAANDRIDNLEIRVAHQDEVIEALNKAVIEQWGKLDQALAWIERLEDRLREINMGAVRDVADEPPPPHY